MFTQAKSSSNQYHQAAAVEDSCSPVKTKIKYAVELAHGYIVSLVTSSSKRKEGLVTLHTSSCFSGQDPGLTNQILSVNTNDMILAIIVMYWLAATGHTL